MTASATSIRLSVPPPLSLAGRAGYTFEPATMIQGFACYGRGVELHAATPKHVRARVRSKRTHDVDLHARNGRLVVACSCPARSFGQTVCKHVWAALLEIDRQGGLEDLHRTSGLLPVDAESPVATIGSPAATLETEMKPRHRRAAKAEGDATPPPELPKPKKKPAKAPPDPRAKHPKPAKTEPTMGKPKARSSRRRPKS